MTPLEEEALREQVKVPDRFAIKDADGFWTFLSELDDARFIVEYSPVFRVQGDIRLVIGPWGIRDRLPLESPVDDLSRVLLAVTSAPLEPSQARYVAALISSHSVTLLTVEGALEPSEWPLENVLYEICHLGQRSGLMGSVERYSEDSVFRLDTGDETPLEDLAHMLWPAGGQFDPIA